MWRSICFAIALLMGMTQFVLPAAGQTKSKPRFVVKVVSVGRSPGFWSGIVEADQSLDGVVVESSAMQFPVGKHLHIEVPIVSGSSIVGSAPGFDESKVSVGKLLKFTVTKACIQFQILDELKIDPSCIRAVKR
jgi:hypothetical protein